MVSVRSNLCVVLLLLLAAVCEAQWPWDWLSESDSDLPLTSEPTVPGLSTTFYSETCPQAKMILKRLVYEILSHDKNLAGGFQRIQFHDCWVTGCDGSVLLNSTDTNAAERDGFTNFKLRAIDEIDQIKAALEQACPETVSCADIIALAARDATVYVGGPTWRVPLGRRDSRVSLAFNADSNLPFPSMNFTELTDNFARKGFNSREMIVLSGSHTIGRTHCNGIGPNLYNYTGIEDLTNPKLDPQFADRLKQQCPKGNRTNIVDMDTTKNVFDNDYYQEVLKRRGVFISDLALIENSFGLDVVKELVKPGSSFFQEFADGMVKLSSLSPLTGSQGRSASAANSSTDKLKFSLRIQYLAAFCVVFSVP